MRISTLLVLSTLALAAAPPAFSQTPGAQPPSGTVRPTLSGSLPRGDFDAGADALTWVTNQATTTTYKGGWHAGGSYRIRRVISAIAEASGDYRSAGGHTTNIYMYGGGARFEAGNPDRRFRPFAQVLFGGGQDNGFGGAKTNHYPMMNPGGGVDLGISPRAAVRIRLDFPLLMTFGDPLSGQVSAGHTLKCTRISIGVTLPYGRR